MGNENAVLEQEHVLVNGDKAGERRRLPVESTDIAASGKSIVTLQFCMTCNRTFAPQRGRKRCPSCQDLLRSKTLVVRLCDPR